MWYYFSSLLKNTIFFSNRKKKMQSRPLQHKLIKKQYVVEFLMCVARKWKSSSCSIEDEIYLKSQTAKNVFGFFSFFFFWRNKSLFFGWFCSKYFLFVCYRPPHALKFPQALLEMCRIKNETSDYILTPLRITNRNETLSGLKNPTNAPL